MNLLDQHTQTRNVHIATTGVAPIGPVGKYNIVFICFSAVPNSFKYHQNVCFKDIVFNIFSAVPNSFKYHQNVCFKDIVFKM